MGQAREARGSAVEVGAILQDVVKARLASRGKVRIPCGRVILSLSRDCIGFHSFRSMPLVDLVSFTSQRTA